METIKTIMNRCTETAKPQISILMAVYEPRMNWLREQLLSLDAQAYPNLKLYIRDDCSPTVPFDAIQSCVQDCIRAFSYEIKRNEKNLGSNKTFERLTQEADGEYFAYCDQDDVWLPEKLAALEAELTERKASLVCSDVYVIDGEGKQCTDSITNVRSRHIFLSGEGVFRSLLTRNFVIGCTMLVQREIALEAVPFLDEMVHDHWLALIAAHYGTVVSVEKPLIRYRIHGENQTGVLVGISTKGDYKKRINLFEERIRRISERLPDSKELQRVQEWAEARRMFADGELCGAKTMWKHRRENFATTVFELVTLKLPEPLFRFALRFAKKT